MDRSRYAEYEKLSDEQLIDRLQRRRGNLRVYL